MEKLKEVTTPLQSTIDVLNQRVPGLSDVSEQYGSGEKITILNLIWNWAVLNHLQDPKPFFDAIASVNALSVDTNVVYQVNLGDFQVGHARDATLADVIDPMPDGSALTKAQGKSGLPQ